MYYNENVIVRSISDMENFLVFLLAGVLLALLGVLGTGVYHMLTQGKYSKSKSSNRYMRWRIILQFVALMIFTLLLTIMKK